MKRLSGSGYKNGEVADVLDAAADFYDRADVKWGRGQLHRRNGEFCVLGAISAVVTNEDYLRKEGGKFSSPTRRFKKYGLIKEAAVRLSMELSPSYNTGARHDSWRSVGRRRRGFQWADVFQWNDRAGSRVGVQQKLRETADKLRASAR